MKTIASFPFMKSAVLYGHYSFGFPENEEQIDQTFPENHVVFNLAYKGYPRFQFVYIHDGKIWDVWGENSTRKRVHMTQCMYVREREGYEWDPCFSVTARALDDFPAELYGIMTYLIDESFIENPFAENRRD